MSSAAQRPTELLLSSVLEEDGLVFLRDRH